jgi:hypothetical protein
LPKVDLPLERRRKRPSGSGPAGSNISSRTVAPVMLERELGSGSEREASSHSSAQDQKLKSLATKHRPSEPPAREEEEVGGVSTSLSYDHILKTSIDLDDIACRNLEEAISSRSARLGYEVREKLISASKAVEQNANLLRILRHLLRSKTEG